MRVLIYILFILNISCDSQILWDYSIISNQDVSCNLNIDEFPDITNYTYSAVGNSITQCCSGCTFVYTTVLDDSTSLGTITNRGVSGNTFARIPGVRVGFRTQVMQSYGDSIISIFGGTNDWVFHVPLGDTTDHNDTNNVSGAVNYFIDLLESNSPESILFFVIPLTRSRDTTGAEIGTEPLNRLGLTVEDYGNAIKEVCEFRGVRYLDLYQISGFMFSDIENWAADGLHPNNTGQMRLGRYIKYYLLEQCLDNLY